MSIDDSASTTSERPRCLVVAAGPDVGARLIIDGDGLLVGRSRDANLVLTDRSVSRNHVHVGRGADQTVRVVACQGVQPPLVNEREVLDADARVGDRIVIGNTVLVVAEADARSAFAHDAMATTQADRLLHGVAGDIRNLAAIYALNLALMGTEDRAAFERVVAEWARAYAATERIEVSEADSADIGGGVLEGQAASGTLFIVPVDAGKPTRFYFHTHLPREQVTDALRRLLLVAAALCGACLSRLLVRERLEIERASLRQLAVGSAQAFLGRSLAAQAVARVIPKLAVSEATVVFLGESGGGKSFVARLVHESGPRAREPFRVINCAAIPENLVESELFGHERGAFSGADVTREGAFEAAGAGTIFLDEIGELPIATQAKLLRVLEDRRFERLGSNRSIAMRARVLVATNRDLEEMIEKGTFRRDLYYRLNVITIEIPALRERGEDVIALANHILGDVLQSAARRVDGFSPAALDVIRAYTWPGNVRELRNCIEHAVVMGDTRLIEPCDFPSALAGLRGLPAEVERKMLALPAPMAVVEREAIKAALDACDGNRTRAAALLGINRQTLYNKLTEHGQR